MDYPLSDLPENDCKLVAQGLEEAAQREWFHACMASGAARIGHIECAESMANFARRYREKASA